MNRLRVFFSHSISFSLFHFYLSHSFKSKCFFSLWIFIELVYVYNMGIELLQRRRQQQRLSHQWECAAAVTTTGVMLAQSLCAYVIFVGDWLNSTRFYRYRLRRQFRISGWCYCLTACVLYTALYIRTSAYTQLNSLHPLFVPFAYSRYTYHHHPYLRQSQTELSARTTHTHTHLYIRINGLTYGIDRQLATLISRGKMHSWTEPTRFRIFFFYINGHSVYRSINIWYVFTCLIIIIIISLSRSQFIIMILICPYIYARRYNVITALLIDS